MEDNNANRYITENTKYLTSNKFSHMQSEGKMMLELKKAKTMNQNAILQVILFASKRSKRKQR